jgi:hypothetical protein
MTFVTTPPNTKGRHTASRHRFTRRHTGQREGLSHAHCRGGDRTPEALEGCPAIEAGQDDHPRGQDTTQSNLPQARWPGAGLDLAQTSASPSSNSLRRCIPLSMRRLEATKLARKLPRTSLRRRPKTRRRALPPVATAPTHGKRRSRRRWHRPGFARRHGRRRKVVVVVWMG